MRPWSVRWWFENRHTGAITIAQFPNLPLWIALAAWVVERIANGVVATTAQAVVDLSVLWWAGDEIVRGVNPWRRALGIGGVIWVVVRVLG